MSKHKGKGNSSSVEVKRDALANILAKSINAQFKEFTAAHFLDGESEEHAATEITEWISTGDDILDLRISNRPHGGIPVGKITEINGLESSGKSLILAHLIAETQKKGGIAVLFDTEFSAQPEFLEAIGVDSKNLVYAQLESLEDIFMAVEKIIMEVREKNRDRLVFIGIDSIAGATTKVEQEQDYDKEGWATAKAIIMSKAMRKITSLIAKQRIALVCTNQLREKLGVMFGDKYTTSGGKALGFHSSVRLRLAKLGEIKIGTEAAGIEIKVKVAKNRIGPPLRTSVINMYFNRGIDRFGSWLDALKEHDIAVVGKGKGASVEIKSEGIDILVKDWNKTLVEDVVIREKIYKLICEKLIMKYSSDQSATIDGTEISTADMVDD